MTYDTLKVDLHNELLNDNIAEVLALVLQHVDDPQDILVTFGVKKAVGRLIYPGIKVNHFKAILAFFTTFMAADSSNKGLFGSLSVLKPDLLQRLFTAIMEPLKATIWELEAKQISLHGIWIMLETLQEEMNKNKVKLVLNHQESRTCQNHNMVKFRALLGEASLHKKGTCSVSESAVPTSRNRNKTNDTYFCQYCAKQFKLNWLIIR
jgi:hypothetical protein